MKADHPSPLLVRESLARLAAEPELARSQQLIDFLTYVVEKTLTGEEDRLKAYSIATEVFGRDDSFDPQTDSIVRVQARRLRRVLDGLYRRGVPGLKVRIDLPVGRYIPQFRWATPGETGEKPSSKRFGSGEIFARVAKSLSGSARYGWLGVLVLIAFGSGVLFLQTHQNLFETPRGEFAPSGARPNILVSQFLADNPANSDLAVAFGAMLIKALSVYDRIDVHLSPQGASGIGDNEPVVYQLVGNLMVANGGIEVHVVLLRKPSDAVVWMHDFFYPSLDAPHEQALMALAEQVSTNVGSIRGALHQDARTLLPDSAFTGTEASHYACGLLFRDATGPGRAAETEKARACYEALLARDGSDIMVHAVIGVLDAFDVYRHAAPGDDLGAKLKKQITDVKEATITYPTFSVVHELYGRILWIAGDQTGARRALKRALTNNPGNSDAMALLGIAAVLTGDREGRHYAEDAIALSLWPADWYYTSRALDCIRHQDYPGAIRHALKMRVDDPELSLAILIAAAAHEDRSDLLTAYTPLFLAQPQFRTYGIMKRLSVRVLDNSLLAALRTGLTLAGVSDQQLDHPYDVPVSLTP